MAQYLITNTSSGVELGVYEGASEAEALEAMARAAGYADYAECCTEGHIDPEAMVATRVEA